MTGSVLVNIKFAENIPVHNIVQSLTAHKEEHRSQLEALDYQLTLYTCFCEFSLPTAVRNIHQFHVTIITINVSLITIAFEVSPCLFDFSRFFKHIYAYLLTYISSNATLHCNEFVTLVTYKTGERCHEAGRSIHTEQFTA
jgi:hypothetical protein